MARISWVVLKVFRAYRVYYGSDLEDHLRLLS